MELIRKSHNHEVQIFSRHRTKKRWGTNNDNLASILYKSTAGRNRPVRVADGPITARCRFMKNAYWEEKVAHMQRRTATEEESGNGQKKTYWDGFKLVYSILMQLKLQICVRSA